MTAFPTAEPTRFPSWTGRSFDLRTAMGGALRVAAVLVAFVAFSTAAFSAAAGDGGTILR